MKKEFDIKGMHCKACEEILKEGVGELKGVSSVKASATSGKLIVDFNDNETTEKQISDVVAKEGYKVVRK
jgi:copper chaperone CopZ